MKKVFFVMLVLISCSGSSDPISQAAEIEMEGAEIWMSAKTCSEAIAAWKEHQAKIASSGALEKMYNYIDENFDEKTATDSNKDLESRFCDYRIARGLVIASRARLATNTKDPTCRNIDLERGTGYTTAKRDRIENDMAQRFQGVPGLGRKAWMYAPTWSKECEARKRARAEAWLKEHK